MFVNERAAEAASRIVTAFRSPNDLPKPLSQMFIHRNDSVPCRNWSWRNQLLVALAGYSDARGYCQWVSVGRTVNHGEKAFYILSPITKKVEDKTSGEEKKVITAFKGTAVFGLEQTDGDQLDVQATGAQEWIKSLPLIEVAQAWGLTVDVFNGQGGRILGSYCNGNSIALGVENLSTWMHELIHAADDRNGKLTKLGPQWKKETVAELGGAILLTVLGLDHDADLGGCWEYVRRYAVQQKLEVVEACGLVIDRTCEAVALILDTAAEMNIQLLTKEARHANR